MNKATAAAEAAPIRRGLRLSPENNDRLDRLAALRPGGGVSDTINDLLDLFGGELEERYAASREALGR